tara:strand:- start:1232 stop:1855 length:624 start_codon:yes stop_codon:yes gene_type:complete
MDPNEKLTGITQMAPAMMGGPQGGPPPGPPMGGPPPGMGGGQPPMPEQGMGEMAMQGQPPMEEEAPDPQQDSAMLAEAVVGRAGGDINAAIGMLDNAKSMLIQASGEGQDPMMAMNGGPMYKNMGGPMYREGGGSMSDSDMLRQMIMDNLQKPDMKEQMMAEAMAQLNGQTGRAVSDKDISGRGMSDKNSMSYQDALDMLVKQRTDG